MRSFNIKNAKDIQNKTSFTKRANINGENIDKDTEKTKYYIMSGMKKLADKGLATYSSDGGSDSLTNDAETLLSAVGASIDTTMSKDLDLKSAATNQEAVQNPNIEDDFKNTKNEKVNALDKFKDTDDSFYNLDEKQRQHIQKKSSSLKKSSKPDKAIQKLAADMAINIEM